MTSALYGWVNFHTTEGCHFYTSVFCKNITNKEQPVLGIGRQIMLPLYRARLAVIPFGLYVKLS